MQGDSSIPNGNDSLAQALQLVANEIRRRALRHPQGHLLSGANDWLELGLRVPVVPHRNWLAHSAREASASLDEALRELLLHRGVFFPGRVYCLRCRSPQCEHAALSNPAEVFAGYGPSGLPRFIELGQWLLECHESRIDQLYRKPPDLLAHVTSGARLTGQLLPAFRDLDTGYHIHGQVAVGWYMFPDHAGLDLPVALTFQVVSSQPADGQLRLRLNLLGSGPGGEPLETLFDHTGELPWSAAAQWAQNILRQVERSLTHRPAPTEEQVSKRLEGLLNGLARRLERHRRSRDRRTAHGQKRHQDKDRPTWKALADLAEARKENLLFDTRRDTLIVLGDHGRAHVFTLSGKLVTSIRYSPAAIERRRQRGIWRTATNEEIEELRELSGVRDPIQRL